MARIRTVKPEFFRHEGLQDLEAANPGAHCMLVFAGLWGHCDKNGVFEWKPRQLKLDILPFLQYDLNASLALLMGAGFLRKFVSGGREYGVIDSFAEHQRLGGKEAQDPPKFPSDESGSNGEASGNPQGSTREATGLAGREGKGMDSASVPAASPPKRTRERTKLPPDFALDSDMRAAMLRRFPDCDVDRAFLQFRAHHEAHGSTMASWRAAWTTWIGNAEKFGYPKASGGQWH